MLFKAVNPYSCPRCGSEDAEYTEDDWDAGTNTETLRKICFRCKCQYTVISKYEPVDIVKKVGWKKEE